MRTEPYLSIINTQPQKAIGLGDFFCGRHKQGKMEKIISQADTWMVFLVKSKNKDVAAIID